MVISSDSKNLYTVAGYAGAGFYKSTDGGRNWVQKFQPDMLAKFPAQGIEKLSMDPTNDMHLTATFHSPCRGSPNGGGEWACIAETHDGGETFRLTHSAQNWSEGDGQTMLNDKTWFFSTGGGTIWRTVDAGATWNMVYNGFAIGEYNSSGCIYTARDGSFYTGGGRGMAHSADGIVWKPMPNTPPSGGPNGGCTIIEDDSNFYVSMGLVAYSPAFNGWLYAAASPTPRNWAQPANNPAVITGAGSLRYEADHKLLYSSNATAGFYRVRLR